MKSAEGMSAAGRAGIRSWLLLPAAVLVMAGLAAGCGSSKPDYCKAGDQLKTSVQNLGNVDVANNGLDSLTTALSSVKSDASTFATEAKSEYAPQTTALQQSLTGLDTAVKAAQGQPLTAASTQAITSSLTQVKTAATDLQNAISGKCK